MRRSTIKRTITADKAGIIEHLREQRQIVVAQAATCETRRERDRKAGERDGLDFAIGVLEDWDY